MCLWHRGLSRQVRLCLTDRVGWRERAGRQPQPDLQLIDFSDYADFS
jgi:hypothetical protein